MASPPVAELPRDGLVLAPENVGYHAARLALPWRVEHHGRIRRFSLPAYSPELQLIERVLRHLEGQLSCRRYQADLDGLSRATTIPLGQMQARPYRHDEPSYG